jgi:carboxylesterase type B
MNLKIIGIPFAEPPVGNLRLQPPILKTHLNVSTFDASNFGPGCLQLVSRFMVPFHFMRV